MKGLYIVSHLAPYRDQTIALVNKKKEYCIHTYGIYKKANTHPEWEYVNEDKWVHFFEEEKVLPILGTWNPDVVKTIKKFRDVDFYLLGGYRPATLGYIVFQAIKSKKPFIYSTDKKEFGTKFGDSMARFICNRATAVWVPGVASKKYLKSIGVDENKIYMGCYTNSHSRLIRDIKSHINQRELLRESMGINPDDIVFLFIGKLIPTRKIGNLVQAFEHMSENKNIKLLVIGTGPERELVQNVENVISIEQCPLDELYQYYMCADAYVHPGNEPYSLALADAAVAGLPIVATSGVGAVEDVVNDGKNGFIVPEDDISALVKAMGKVYHKCYDSESVFSMQLYLVNERGISWAAEELTKAIGRCNRS